MSGGEKAFFIRDLIVVLLRDQNIHSGYWGLSMHFTAVGTSVTSIDQFGLPGLVAAVNKVTLVPVKDLANGGVDASLVNPMQ